MVGLQTWCARDIGGDREGDEKPQQSTQCCGRDCECCIATLRTHATATQAVRQKPEENHIQHWSCEPRVELGVFRIRVKSVAATVTCLAMWIREREFEIGHTSGVK